MDGLAGIAMASIGTGIGLPMIVGGVSTLLTATIPRRRLLQMKRSMFKRHTRRTLDQLNMPDGLKASLEQPLSAVVASERAAICWRLLLVIPGLVLIVLGFSALLFAQSGPSDPGESDWVFIRVAVAFVIAACTYLLILLAVLSYQDRHRSDEAVIISCTFIIKKAAEARVGAGLDRARPLLWQLEGHERYLNIFFSQLIGDTDSTTASFLRERWAGQIEAVRNLKQQLLMGNDGLKDNAIAYSWNAIFHFTLATVGELPVGDAKLVEGIDARIAPRAVALSAVAVFLATALTLTAADYPWAPAAASAALAAAVYFLRKVLPMAFVRDVLSRYAKGGSE